MNRSFKDQLESLKTAWGVVMAAVAAGPTALWTTELQPPWPSGSALVATTACAFAIWIAFSIKTLVKRLVLFKAIGTASLVLGVGFGALYFTGFNRYVISLDVESQQNPRSILVVIGSELKLGVTLGQRTEREALNDALGEADKVWTERSIRLAKGSLLGTFVGAFFCLSLGSTIVTLSKRLTHPRAANP